MKIGKSPSYNYQGGKSLDIAVRIHSPKSNKISLNITKSLIEYEFFWCNNKINN